MKSFKICAYALLVASLAATLPSCKSKKLITKSTPPAQPVDQPAPVQKTVPLPPPQKEEAPVPQKPDFNFNNIQFDFNSSVLRTDAIQYLEHVADEMKKDPSAKFMLNGYASAEGTAQHNIMLSEDRANAVKQYLLNGGINPENLSVKGYGEADPIAPNDTEEGRVKNRRVEIKIIP